MLDRKTEFEQLQRRSDDLHNCLPGTSSNQPNTIMDKVYDKVRDLEAKINTSMKKSEEVKKSMKWKEEKESDEISMASTGGQSLTLEVQVENCISSSLPYTPIF